MTIKKNLLNHQKKYIEKIPSRELTYPTWGKGESSSKCHFWGDMLIPRRVHWKDNTKPHNQQAPFFRQVTTASFMGSGLVAIFSWPMHMARFSTTNGDQRRHLSHQPGDIADSLPEGAPQCTAHILPLGWKWDSCWWLFPNPFWKICKRQSGSFTQGLGWTWKIQYLKPPPWIVLNKGISLWPPSFVGSNHFRPQHPLNLRCEPTDLDLLVIFFNKSTRENRWMFV